MEDWLRPGSNEAIDKGCACPVLDNGHGRGYLGDGKKFGWVINGTCPLHGGVVHEDLGYDDFRKEGAGRFE